MRLSLQGFQNSAQELAGRDEHGNCAGCRAESEWRASEIFNPCETFGIFGDHIPGLLYGVDIGSPAFLRLGDRPPDRSAHKSTGFTAPVQLVIEYMRNRMRSKI